MRRGHLLRRPVDRCHDHAGAGNDDVRGGFNPGTTTAYLGDGNDEISASGVVTAVACSQGGNDTLIGGSQDDYLYGGAGSDKATVDNLDLVWEVEQITVL